jgi:hypothetical protein
VAVTTFYPDARFVATLEKLRCHYALSSKSAVILKAVALLSIISELEDDSGSVTLAGAGGDVRVCVR